MHEQLEGTSFHLEDVNGPGAGFHYVQRWVDDEDDPNSEFEDSAVTVMGGAVGPDGEWDTVGRLSPAPERLGFSVYRGEPGNGDQVPPAWPNLMPSSATMVSPGNYTVDAAQAGEMGAWLTMEAEKYRAGS